MEQCKNTSVSSITHLLNVMEDLQLVNNDALVCYLLSTAEGMNEGLEHERLVLGSLQHSAQLTP